ncbi:f60e6f6c-7c0c-490a-9ba3-6f819f76c17c [Sclerotinia trifoliorum]|uniref:F60e6f6c-7c0c-490a-9ba3-6f819f76c17c n=1 Tax=Sclerotinia trifoliorum TaxID=28548 RepID=A0A8H2ZS74_9HELO|nr:f60e6f6c-7c0c-490a-9ba3-6f819f76c17c [Sclerotinia trifoliorum]
MTPRLPAFSANSNDVRAYISRTLITKLGTSPDIAEETAKLWKDGRGAELYDFSARAFKSVFGEQTGWSLFRIVHEDKLQDWKQSIVGLLSSYALFGAIIVTICLILRLLLLYASKATFPYGFKKGGLPVFQALLILGLSMINYGLQTPSIDEGQSLAIAGMMISFTAAIGTLLCSLPDPALMRGEEGK